jgi:ribose transport system permease protein
VTTIDAEPADALPNAADNGAASPSRRLTATPSTGWITRLGLDRFSALYLWAAFMIFFGLSRDQFLTRTSIELVLTDRALIVAILALAFLVPLTAETFDLSIGAMMSLSLVIVSWMARDTEVNQVVSALLALAACAAIGFVNGFIVVKLRVNSFIATLGMSQVISALILYISANRQISGVLSDGYRSIGTNELFGFPYYFFYLLVLAAGLWFMLEHTPIGRYLFATGGNREAARLSGVNTDKLTWMTLVLSALIAGFAGIVFSWRTPIFSQTTGPGFLFPAVAAVFFGASQLKGRANVLGTLIAVYALAFGVKGLQLFFSAGTYWIEPMFEGLSLLFAVAIASRKNIIKVPKRRRPERDPGGITVAAASADRVTSPTT